MKKLIGREKERLILEEALASGESEMIAVTGRRRVGKTFLVRSVYADKIDLEFTGVQNAPRQEQIDNFRFLLQQFAGDEHNLPKPKNWLTAFHQLITVLNSKKNSKKKLILFFDELPWLATKKSGFLRAFGFFWNNWATKNNVIVVICGSAASWIIEKVVKDKGGLHNRITKRINVKPFNLAETETFFDSRNIRLNHYQTALIYMIMGGIPHYLKEVKPGKSAIQNINDICFLKEGLLSDEFVNLYPALFEQSDNHIAIIRALATNKRGLTRKKIIELAKLPQGGGTSKVLNELIYSGFISEHYPFGKKRRDMLYRLTDEYSLFYLNFIEKRKRNVQDAWQELSQSSTFKSWSGYAFESLCLKHIPQIKKALQIGGVYSESSGFLYRGDDTYPGIQIDLLIDRNDQVINICEIKFYNGPFTITKDYAEKLRTKITVFSEVTKTRKQIFLTLISTFGITQNKNSIGLIDNSITMDALFDE